MAMGWGGAWLITVGKKGEVEESTRVCGSPEASSLRWCCPEDSAGDGVLTPLVGHLSDDHCTGFHFFIPAEVHPCLTWGEILLGTLKHQGLKNYRGLAKSQALMVEPEG